MEAKSKIQELAKSMKAISKSLSGIANSFNLFSKAATVRTPNRDYLRDFVKMNNIKPTLVSQALGKSRNWLTQMMNDKRRDMKEDTLQSIMKQLHIDWSSSTFLNVKATDEHTAYRTKPCNYTTDAHKLVLQRRFWDGLVK